MRSEEDGLSSLTFVECGGSMNLVSFRAAQSDDLDTILGLMPELADFQLPAKRIARHLWEGDAELLRAVLEERSVVTFVDVAVDENDRVLGVIMVTLREELLSHEASAHLETIIVSPGARGQGIGRRLLQRAEHKAAAMGAQSLTLHVFNNNSRARALYQSNGYDEELLRCIKWLNPSSDNLG